MSKTHLHPGVHGSHSVIGLSSFPVLIPVLTNKKWQPRKGFQPLRMSATLNFNFIAMIIIALSIAGVFGLYASVLMKPGHDNVHMPGF